MLAIGIFLLWRRNEVKKQQEKLDTERKVNAQLRRLNKLKDQFLANTSHELRTPLTSVRGYAENRLGPRVLRTETAAITGLALLQAAFGDLG